MAPVVAKVDKYCCQIPRVRRIPGQIKQTKVVVNVKIGSVFNSTAKNAAIESIHKSLIM